MAPRNSTYFNDYWRIATAGTLENCNEAHRKKADAGMARPVSMGSKHARAFLERRPRYLLRCLLLGK